DALAIDSDSVRAAARITPNGRYVELPGDDQLLFLGDPDPALGEIAEFLTGARGHIDPDRTLSSVLFTDIVGSTQQADRRWRSSVGWPTCPTPATAAPAPRSQTTSSPRCRAW